MAADPLVEVGFDGDQYMVPKSVIQAGMAKVYIEDQLAEQADRKVQQQAKVQQSVDNEFATIKRKLKKVDFIEDEIAQMQQSVEAYASANAALKAQVAALEESGGVLGGANAEARQTAYDLSNAATSGANLLAQLQTAQTVLNERLDQMFARIEQLQLAQAKVIADAAAAAETNRELLQQAVARATGMASNAEVRAAQAEGVANQALSDAQNAKNLGRNDVTRDQLLAMIQSEIHASSSGFIEMAVDQIREQFPQGIHGQRLDGEYLGQAMTDGTNAADIRYGDDEAMKRTRRSAGL